MFPLWQIVVVLSLPTLFIVVGIGSLLTPPGPKNARGLGAAVLVLGSLMWAGALYLQPWRAEGRWRFEKRGDEDPPKE